MTLEIKFYLCDAPNAIKKTEISIEAGDSIQTVIEKCLLIENSGFKKEDLLGSTFLLDNNAVELSYKLTGKEQKLFFLNSIIGG